MLPREHTARFSANHRARPGNICLHAAFPAEREIEGDADEGAEKGAGGGGEAHRVEGVREQLRGEPCARDAYEDHRAEIMDEAEDREAGGTEEAGEWEVNAGDHAVEHVGAHILYRECLHDRILREQREERRGDELEQDREEEADATGEADTVPECLTRPRWIAGTDRLRRDRRHRRQHAGWHQEEKADRLLDDTDRRRDVDATPVRDYGDDQKRNLDEAVLAGDREANAENLVQHRRVPPGAAIRAGSGPPSFILLYIRSGVRCFCASRFV